MDLNKENESQEGITVAIRMRPLNKNEGEKQRVWKVLPKYNSVTQTTSTGKPLSERVTGRTYFAFDKVFEENVDTNQVYDDVAKGIVSSVVNGLNGTIFAYGQTSSGKTYTMQGSGSIQEGASENGGIVHMAARDIFSNIQSQPNRMFLVRASFLEIYNEEVRDLLSTSSNILPIREDPRRGVFVQSQEEMVTDFNSLLRLLFQGEKSRQVASTGMNERSSRSHTIFRITVESRENEEGDEFGGSDSSTDGAVRISTLNLVDLAGSESVRHTGATGDRQKEGGMINQSLLTLSRVIVALGQPNSMHINFRDSKLTRILQPSLSGNARMAIICCATPSELYLEETRSTLQFASRAKLVTTNAQVNEVLDDRSIIRRLQRELAEARGQTKGPGTEHLRALESKAAHAGTEAMKVKKQLDRLQKSILNAASLFGGNNKAARAEPDTKGSSLPHDIPRSRKRRKSDSMVPLSYGSTPPRSTIMVVESPKTAPRANKQKTSHPQLSPRSELSILREALSNRGELSRALKATLEKNVHLLQQKEDAFKQLESANDELSSESERAVAELAQVRSAFEIVQGNLTATIGEYDALLAEKESVILNTFQKVEAGNSSVTGLEEANEELNGQLQDLTEKFDLLQQERIRGAFELAQLADEREKLQQEREHDKLIIAEMNQKIGLLTSQANESEKKCHTSNEIIGQLQGELSVATAEKLSSCAKADEIKDNVHKMKEQFEEEIRAAEACRHELESQLETNVSEKENALVRVLELEEKLQGAQVDFEKAHEAFLQATSERDWRISELENHLKSTTAEKDDQLARAIALSDDLKSAEAWMTEANSKIGELEKTLIHEQETCDKRVADAQDQLEALASEKNEALENAERYSSDVQCLQQEVVQLHALNNEIQRETEKYRLEYESKINELRRDTETAMAEKIAATERCVGLEEQSVSLMKTIEACQLHAADLHATLVEAEEKCNCLEQELRSSEIREENLSEQFEALQLEYTQLQQEVEESFRQNLALESSLSDAQEEYKRNLTEQLIQNETLLLEKAALEAMLTTKEESLLSLQSSYTSLRTQVTSKEIEESELVQRIGNLSNELEMIRSECISLEASNEKLQKSENTLYNQLASLQDMHEHHLTTTFRTQEEETEKIKSRLSLLLDEKSEIERFLAAAEEESSAMQEQNAVLEETVSDLRFLLAAVQGDLVESNETRDGLHSKVEELEKTIECLSSEVHLTQEDVAQHKAENIENESRIMSLEAEKIAILAAKDSLQVTQQEQMQTLEERFEAAEDQLEVLSYENKELLVKCNQYDRKVKHLEAQVETFHSTNEAFTSQERELRDQSKSASNDLVEAQRSIAEIKAENAALRNQFEDLKKSSRDQTQSLETELSALKDAYEKTDRALQRCQKDLESIKISRDNALNSLKARELERDMAVSEMENLYAKHQELSKDLSNALCGEKRTILEKEIVDLRQSSLELKQLLLSTTGSEGRLRERLAAAESEVLAKTRALEDSQYRLSHLEDELRQSELAFEQKHALDLLCKTSPPESQDLLNEIESLKSILIQEREDRKKAENDLKKQMGEEQRILIQEGEKMMAELRVKIVDLEKKLTDSEHEAYTSRQQLDELHDENKSRERACQDLQKALEDIESSLSRKEKQLLSLQQDLNNAKADSYTLKENGVELREKAKSDARIIEKLERDNVMATSEVALLKRQLASLDKAKSEIQAENERMTAKAKAGSNSMQQAANLADNVKHLEIVLLKREETIKQLQLEIASTRQGLSSSTQLTEELQHLKTKLSEKDQRIKKLQQFKLTKEFAEEHKQLKRDNLRLREEVAQLHSNSDSALRTEVSELRFDKEALEKKLRKFAAHCQRLEDDKVGVMETLRSCNINLASYDEINQSIILLCDQLASLQESSSSSNVTLGSIHEKEKENQALRIQLDRVVASEERLSEQAIRFQKEADELRKKLKEMSENSDSESAGISETSRKLRYLEQENLQLMYDVKMSKKQLQVAREEIEVLRLNTLDNTTMDIGTVDLGSHASSEDSNALSNLASSSRPTTKLAPLSDTTNRRAELGSRHAEKHSSSESRNFAPGLGEASIQGDDTAECNQS